MRFHLQEAYKLPNGEMNTPHWDEWFNMENQLAVPDEEVEAGIEHLGEWYEVSEWLDGPEVGTFVWRNVPEWLDNGSASGVYEVESIGDMVNLKCKDGSSVECYLDECQTMPLYRRIAEVG